jgi:dienelactone hydrolase
MNLSVKISLAAAGLFLLTGMLLGIVKYRRTMTSAEHRAPIYIDIAHRAAFLYSFAALVIARLLEYNPYSLTVQLVAAIVPLAFFALTIIGYATHGFREDTDNMFRERNFITTWFMYALIAGEVGGMSVILWGFVTTQFLR